MLSLANVRITSTLSLSPGDVRIDMLVPQRSSPKRRERGNEYDATANSCMAALSGMINKICLELLFQCIKMHAPREMRCALFFKYGLMDAQLTNAFRAAMTTRVWRPLFKKGVRLLRSMRMISLFPSMLGRIPSILATELGTQ